MRLELKDIKGGILEQDYVCSLTDFPELEKVAEQGAPVYQGSILFFLRLQRSGQIVELDGRFEAFIQMKCGRCLESFKRKVDESFSLTFSPYEGNSRDADDEEVELEADELGLILYQDEVIDLHPALQEQLMMAMPIRPLCSADCKGLCSECGVNLNQKKCQCVKKPFNNKFSVLADIDFKED